MRSISPILFGMAFILLACTLAGCNLFDGMDTALTSRTDQELVEEGNLALESGNFSLAIELFTRVGGSRYASEVARGVGEGQAGLSGFKLLTVLNALQNGTGPYDRSPVIFRCFALTGNRSVLESGIVQMMKISEPQRPDFISRGLMRLVSVSALLIEKYDTNHNKHLDLYDEIDYDTNDKSTPTWLNLYSDLIKGPSTKGTLETVFTDLFNGFDGRGDAWSFISPVEGKMLTGTFSQSNRATILAVGDLAEKLKAADKYFNVNAASFSAAIRDLDGAE